MPPTLTLQELPASAPELSGSMPRGPAGGTGANPNSRFLQFGGNAVLTRLPNPYTQDAPRSFPRHYPRAGVAAHRDWRHVEHSLAGTREGRRQRRAESTGESLHDGEPFGSGQHPGPARAGESLREGVTLGTGAAGRRSFSTGGSRCSDAGERCSGHGDSRSGRRSPGPLRAREASRGPGPVRAPVRRRARDSARRPKGPGPGLEAGSAAARASSR